jgi:hypothetical protein
MRPDVRTRLAHKLYELKGVCVKCDSDCVRCKQKITSKGGCECACCGKRQAGLPRE